MAAGDIYKVDLYNEFQGNVNLNTYYFNNEFDPATFRPQEELAIWFRDVFVPALVVIRSISLVYSCVVVQKIAENATLCEVRGLPFELSFSVPGEVSAEGALPGQCSMVVQTYNTLLLGNKNYRGRDFFTGFVEGAQVNGDWTQAVWNIFGGILQTHLFGGLIGSDAGEYFWANYSPTLAKERCALPEGTDPLTTFNAWALIDAMRTLKQVRTQRRRQPENPCDKYLTAVV